MDMDNEIKELITFVDKLKAQGSDITGVAEVDGTPIYNKWGTRLILLSAPNERGEGQSLAQYPQHSGTVTLGIRPYFVKDLMINEDFIRKATEVLE